MMDILYLAHGRPEFTQASFTALLNNTSWIGARLVVYTDGDEFFGGRHAQNSKVTLNRVHFGGPVAIMNHFLSQPGSEVFCKLDNDVIVPPGWFEQCCAVMENRPELDLLGIEPPASRTPAPWSNGLKTPAPELCGELLLAGHFSGYAPCDSIGGIGMMRRGAFLGRRAMTPFATYGGFTDWQLGHPHVKKGWIVPPLKLFLLDRLPVSPWRELSQKYIASGEQRPWTNYDPKDSALWDWWLQRN